MNWGTRRLTLGLILSLVVVFSFSGRAQADSKGTYLTTSPISVDLSSSAGSSTSTVLQVQNNSSSTINVNVKLEEFKAVGVNGQAALYRPPANDPSLSWVHFSTTSFSAQPNTWVPVTMTINLPKSASLGYYYAVLFSPSGVSKKQSDANIINSANAIFVLVNTNSKNEARRLSIQSFTASKGLYNFLPVTFNVLVHNPGNINLQPQGDIYISRKPGGKTIDSLPINPGYNNVLPDSSRLFSAKWTDGFPVYTYKRLNGQILSNKKGQPITQLNWNLNSSLSKFRLGKYYANLVLVYNNGITDVPVNGVVSFWVIPWVLVLEILAVIGLIVLAIKYARKSLKLAWRKLFKKGKHEKAK